MRIEGEVYKLGDNIDTDTIISAKYLTSTDSEFLATHCLEVIDKDFYKKAKGKILVGGKNFGCGSSREHAVLALLGCGILGIVSESFARIFLRNTINLGLVAVELLGVRDIPKDDWIWIDLSKGEVFSKKLNKKFEFLPYPPFLQRIIKKGGLLGCLEDDKEERL